jgi:hypothetical protein
VSKNKDRQVTEEQLEDDILEIGEILNRKARSTADVKRLIDLFDWYCNHSVESFRNMPIELARYIASEVKGYIYSPKKSYRPFPKASGHPGVISWAPIHEQVELLLELLANARPITTNDVHMVFERVIKDQGAETDRPLDQDTVNSQVKKFRREHPELF